MAFILQHNNYKKYKYNNQQHSGCTAVGAMSWNTRRRPNGQIYQ